jgi:hypothetical protein
MYDIFSNNKVFYLKQYDSQAAAATENHPADAGVDLWALSENGLYERNNRVLILIDVLSVGTGGTLDLIIQDYGPDDETWDADFCTLDQITEAGLYMVDLKYFRQKIRLNAVVATDAVGWSAYGVSFDATRRPVKQTWTQITKTYATNRFVQNTDLA